MTIVEIENSEENNFGDTLSTDLINNWDDLEINSDLLRGIYAYGFEKPSPIQQRAIMPMLEKKDIIAQAQSGTGKTATFTIGALSNIDLSNKSTQILVLSPTRELSKQTANVMIGIGSMMKGLVVQTIVGGSSIDDDSEMLMSYVTGSDERRVK